MEFFGTPKDCCVFKVLLSAPGVWDFFQVEEGAGAEEGEEEQAEEDEIVEGEGDQAWR